MPEQKKIKVVHIDTGQALRGGQRQLLLLARGLQKRGHCQLIVCLESGELEARARSEGFAVFPLPAHDPGHAHGIFQVRQLSQSQPFDLLHAHDGRGHTISWLASVGMPLRRVATRRVTFLPSDRWTYRLKYAYTCHAVVAISDFIRRLLVQAGVPEKMITLIRDGIEIPSQSPSHDFKRQLRSQFGFGNAEFIIGHMGAFTPEKGQDVALEALSRVAKQFPEARLLLAGDGPMLASPATAQKLKSLEGRVRLCGSIEDLASFYPALDLFIMPSRAEGLGSSVLHAMAFGLPVVASRTGGLPELVVENETGWLVPPGSCSVLAEAIAVAAADPGRLVEMGRKARERARQFSADIMIEQTEALYRSLLAT